MLCRKGTKYFTEAKIFFTTDTSIWGSSRTLERMVPLLRLSPRRAAWITAGTSPLMHRRRVGVGHEASSAAGFVHTGATDGDTFFRFESALRVVRGLAAPHADGVRLGDVLSNRE